MNGKIWVQRSCNLTKFSNQQNFLLVLFTVPFLPKQYPQNTISFLLMNNNLDEIHRFVKRSKLFILKFI